jgi:CheY-like chemotaxis protein
MGRRFTSLFRATAVLLLLCLWVEGRHPAMGDTLERSGDGDSLASEIPATAVLEMEASRVEAAMTNQATSALPAIQPGGESLAGQNMAITVVVLALVFLLVRRKLSRKCTALFDPWRSAHPTAHDAVADERAFAQFVQAFADGSSLRNAETNRNGAGSVEPGSNRDWLADAGDSRPGARSTRSALEELAVIRQLVSQLARVSGADALQKLLEDLLAHVRWLKGECGSSEASPMSELAGAIAGLLLQLTRNPNEVSGAALRTLASGVDLLHALSVPGVPADLRSASPVRLLTVDDDPVSLKAVGFALKKSLAQPDGASNGEAALALAEANAYDVIFLDIEMPGMDGFEVCARIHGTAANQTTPVVFVTSHTDFQSRAKASVLGAQDLVGKPFLTSELTLKALTVILRRRLSQHGPVAAPQKRAPDKSAVRPPEPSQGLGCPLAEALPA